MSIVIKRRFKCIISIFLLCCVILSSTSLYAANYKYERMPDEGYGSDNNIFYTIDKYALKDAFSFTIGDIFNPISWALYFRTFTVIKELRDENNNFIAYKGYYNTPNLQTMSKNIATADIADGYVGETHDVDQTQTIIPVGKNATTINAISRYGFKLPNYTYYGEYPRLYMSIQNILPTNLFEQIWRTIAAMFGLDFLQAPNAENFRTIKYLNHEYTDKSQTLVHFVQQYWLKYVINVLNTSQFDDLQDFKDRFTTKEKVDRLKDILEKTSCEIPQYSLTFTGTNGNAGIHYGESGGELISQIISNYHKVVAEMIAAGEGDTSTEKPEGPAPVHPEDGNIHTNNGIPDFNEIVTPQMQALHSKYVEYINELEKWKYFQKQFNLGQKDQKNVIHYNQCLITNEGDSTECYSTKYGANDDDKTTLAIGNVLAFSGMDAYITNPRTGKLKPFLTDKDAINVIQSIQTYCGPYYQEVMQNIVVCMAEVAEHKDSKFILNDKYEDMRSMPYDVQTLSKQDRSNYTIDDPRTKRFTDSLFGGIVANFMPGYDFFIYFKIEPFILDLNGTIAEWTIFLQRLKNFDNFGMTNDKDSAVIKELNPLYFWSNNLIELLLYILSILFMISTLKIIISYIRGNKNGSVVKMIVAFLVFVIEVVMLTGLITNRDVMWTTFKNGMNAVMSIGEQSMLTESNEFEYLFGAGEHRDTSTYYYLPYLDNWSKYHTGYSLFDKEHQYIDIDKHKDLPELAGFINEYINVLDKSPKLDYTTIDSRIYHWSILLLDSFSSYGESFSSNSTTIPKGTLPNVSTDIKVNGKLINKNAYRVVDHFMAPRVHITKNDDNSVLLSTTQNENYNGKFQNSNVLELLAGLIHSINLLFISLVQFLTFIWIWFQIYIFTYKVILNKLVEKKSWKEILLELFTPLYYIIILGLYASIVIKLNSILTGLGALLISIGVLIFSKVALLWWSRQKYFPTTLVPLAVILDYKRNKMKYNMEQRSEKVYDMIKRDDIPLVEQDLQNPDKLMELLFTYNEKPNPIYLHSQYDYLYDYWIDLIRNLKKRSGRVPTDSERNALQNYAIATNRMFNLDKFEEIEESKKLRSKHKKDQEEF